MADYNIKPTKAETLQEKDAQHTNVSFILKVVF